MKNRKSDSEQLAGCVLSILRVGAALIAILVIGLAIWYFSTPH